MPRGRWSRASMPPHAAITRAPSLLIFTPRPSFRARISRIAMPASRSLFSVVEPRRSRATPSTSRSSRTSPTATRSRPGSRNWNAIRDDELTVLDLPDDVRVRRLEIAVRIEVDGTGRALEVDGLTRADRGTDRLPIARRHLLAARDGDLRHRIADRRARRRALRDLHRDRGDVH